MAIPLPAVLKGFGCTRNNLNKWKSSGHLAGKIPDGLPGIASMVNREVALEIAFMSVLTAAGYVPRDAKIVARNWLSLHKQKGGLDDIWAFDPMAGLLAERSDGKRETIFSVVSRPIEQVDMPLGAQNRASVTLRVFNVAEIVARLDEIERECKQIERM